jgi:hypothetical protein
MAGFFRSFYPCNFGKPPVKMKQAIRMIRHSSSGRIKDNLIKIIFMFTMLLISLIVRGIG